MGKWNRKSDMDRYRYGRVEKRGESEPPLVALPNSLFVRNIALETSADTICSVFELFGTIIDVYLPKEFSTGMPKGYGFIKFQNGKEAKIAKEYLNHRVIDGQEISIKYSSDSNRKKPRQMELINSRKRETEAEIAKRGMNPGLLLSLPEISGRTTSQSVSLHSPDKKGPRISISPECLGLPTDCRDPSPDTGRRNSAARVNC